MPSVPHETPLAVFEQRPEELLQLLEARGILAVPPHTQVKSGKGQFTDIVPVEWRADLVLILYRGEQPILALIVESQLAIKADKHRAWPCYVAEVHGTYCCPTYLLVIAVDEGVARWAGKGIPTFQPNTPFVPLVMGPADIPIIRSPEDARRRPGLALLSVLAHAAGPDGEEVVYAAIIAARDRDPEEQIMCYLVVNEVLTDELNRKFEARYMISLRDLYQNARDEGIRNAYKDGKTEGKSEGEAKAKAEGILTILNARGIAVTDTQRSRIQACADLPTLDRWFLRALKAASAEDVLQGG